MGKIAVPRGASTVLVIPDLQIPFEHPKAFDFIRRLRDQYRPQRIVCIGDEVDQHALGRFPADPDGLSAGDELALTQKRLVRWFKEFPNVDVVTSNHTMRVYKKAFEHGIPSAMLRCYHELIGAPATWRLRDYHIIDDVRYEHGDAFGGGAGALEGAVNANHRSTVFGHFHAHAGIRYFAKPNGKQMFAMNVGCLIDDKAYAFKYARLSKARPTLGAGVVIDGRWPVWVPL